VRLQRMIQEGNIEALFERMWLSSIVEFSDDAIISKNLDGTITSWNKGAERLFGYPAEDVIGKSITTLIPPERQDEEGAILRLIRRGDRVEHYETVRQRKDGRLVDISLTVSPIKGAAGKVVAASKVARDITERKRIEAQISILARETEHRAKNLLANVTAMVQLSQADTPDGLKEAIQGRIQALASVHSLFAKSHWTGAELDSLVKAGVVTIFPRRARADRRTERHAEAGLGASGRSDLARVGDQCGKVRCPIRCRRSGSCRVVARGRRAACGLLDRSGRSASQTPDPQGLWHARDAEHDRRREWPGATRLAR
jgi:PAS domain S-box-containing protein